MSGSSFSLKDVPPLEQTIVSPGVKWWNMCELFQLLFYLLSLSALLQKTFVIDLWVLFNFLSLISDPETLELKYSSESHPNSSNS